MHAQDDLDGTGPDLPRWQDGKNPQHLLVTIVGDFWVGRAEYLPSASLVKLLADFDVTGDSARAALSRLARRGAFVAKKQGRNTYYHLANVNNGESAEAGSQIMEFGADQNWSGKWTLCAFTLPESRRETRNQLRTRLRAMGFAPLYDGLWASSLDHGDSVLKLFGELEVEQGSVFIASELLGKDRQGIESLWNLDLLREHYDAFLTDWQWVLEDFRKGLVSPKDAFFLRTTMTDTYRRFPKMDPGLPTSALPDDWPRSRVRDLFLTAYDELAPLATLRVQQIVREFSEELSMHVHTHSTKTLGQGAAGIRACALCTTNRVSASV